MRARATCSSSCRPAVVLRHGWRAPGDLPGGAGRRRARRGRRCARCRGAPGHGLPGLVQRWSPPGSHEGAAGSVNVPVRCGESTSARRRDRGGRRRCGGVPRAVAAAVAGGRPRCASSPRTRSGRSSRPASSASTCTGCGPCSAARRRDRRRRARRRRPGDQVPDYRDAPVWVRCAMLRGGTSRGAYFVASDLPGDPECPRRAPGAVLGSPDPLQVDGIGGGHPLTSKVAVVAPSEDPGADVDYLFLQVWPDTGEGLGRPDVRQHPRRRRAVRDRARPRSGRRPSRRTVRIRSLNGGSIAVATVRTPGGRVTTGATLISGVSRPLRRSSSPSRTRSARPRAASSQQERSWTRSTASPSPASTTGCRSSWSTRGLLGLRGDETPPELEADEALRARARLRLEAGRRMGLGDVVGRTVPKVTLVRAARRWHGSRPGPSSRSAATPRSACSAASPSPPPRSCPGRGRIRPARPRARRGDRAPGAPDRVPRRSDLDHGRAGDARRDGRPSSAPRGSCSMVR